MRMSDKVRSRISEMSPDDRFEMANSKLERALDRLLQAIAMVEHNRVVLFSDILSKQIPRSRAANAFNLFREMLHRQEVVSVCALWDSVDLDKFNIPTIVALVDNEDVQKLLHQKIYSSWADQSYNPEPGLDRDTVKQLTQMIEKNNAKEGAQQADKILEQLIVSVASTKEMVTSNLLESIMELRDKHIAHALEITRREKKAAEPIEVPKHGDTGKIITLSIEIVDALTLAIRNTDFAFGQSREIHASCANELWSACNFAIEDRSVGKG